MNFDVKVSSRYAKHLCVRILILFSFVVATFWQAQMWTDFRVFLRDRTLKICSSSQSIIALKAYAWEDYVEFEVALVSLIQSTRYFCANMCMHFLSV